MSQFADLRAEIKDALTAAGINAFLTKPDKFAPPAAFVAPGDPYITREGAVSSRGEVIHHDVTLIVAAGVNETQADALDDLITEALDVLYDLDGFAVGDVDRPGQVSVNGQQHLAASIQITTEIQR